MNNSKDNLQLGQIIEPDRTVERDATHVAICPIVASSDLMPGDPVGVLSCGEAYPAAFGETSVGVVDPFLNRKVRKGERFWLFLKPGSITGLRHRWSHPAFPDRTETPVAALESVGVAKDTKAESEAWLRDFCKHADCPNYEDVLKAASGEHVESLSEEDYGSEGSSNDGEYLHFNGRDAHGEIPEEFWRHVEIVTGKTIQQGKKAKHFSCSC